jgi:hypothetical protein
MARSIGKIQEEKMTTVYLDKRAEEEQAREEIEAIEREEAKQRAMEALATIATTFTNPLVFMLLWNWLVPGIFGLVTIGYLQSFGLYWMSRILFSRK